MTQSEREEAATQMAELTSKTDLYDKWQDKIDWWTSAQGTIHAVNLLTDQGVIAITDADMLAKAETALSKMITAAQTAQAEI